MLNMTIYYVLVLAAIVLPLIFRRSLVLRILCILVLGASLVFVSFLAGFSAHRALVEDGIQHYHVSSTQLPNDFKVAIELVGRWEYEQDSKIAPFAVALAALAILAVIPLKGGFQFRKEPSHDA